MNRRRMKFDPKTNTIQTANPNDEIGPSDICRVSAWGGGTNEDNADLVSINKTVWQALPEVDVRKKYVLIGATWTKGGKHPTRDRQNHEGANKLANSTMETFVQSTDSNCLVCHRDWSEKQNMLEVSHIWSQLKPLRP
jgi:hypothetical protein